MLALAAQILLAKGAVVGTLIYTIPFLVLTRWTVTRDQDYLRRVRDREDLVNLIYYGALSVSSLVFLPEQLEWLVNGFRYERGEEFPSPLSMCLCGLQIGGYFAMSFLVWFQPRKKDALTMTVHHVITATIVLSSAIGGYAHACTTILLLHDLCDPPLSLMTMAGRSGSRVFETIGYCMAVFAFALFRIVLFPYVTYVAAYQNPLPMAPFVISLNAVLWCMHGYWLRILLGQGYRRLKGLPTFDPREQEIVEKEEPTKEQESVEEEKEEEQPAEEEKEDGEEPAEEERAMERSESIGERVRRRRAKKIN